MIVQAQALAKSYGEVQAVDDLSFTIEPGHITGFLGPNGSGKSTTMRLMLGLDHGSGTTLYDGRPLTAHRPVSRVVGAHLDATCYHPQRPARAHLRMMGAEARVGQARIDEVIDLVRGGQGVFGIAVGRVWQEVEGTLASLPSENAADEGSAADELSLRRAARRSG